MKKLLYILTLFLFATGITQKASAQIPNASLETWSNGDPDGWTTTNSSVAGSVTKSTDAHAGSFAAQMNAVATGFRNFGSAALLTTGNSTNEGAGFPIASAPGALYGWYKSNIDSGDEVEVVALIKEGQTGEASSTGFLTTNTNVYKQFVFNFTYAFGTPIGDSAYIIFTLLNGTTSLPHTATTFTIDDLSFGAASSSGVNDIQNPSGITLEQNAPNPAVNETDIIYSVENNTPVTLTIVDVLGRTVKTVINQTQTPGRYKAIINVDDLPNGNYFYQLNEGGNIVSKMMVVAK